MARTKRNKQSVKNPNTTLCDNFEIIDSSTQDDISTSEKKKKRCINCKYLSDDHKSCTLKDNSSVIREVLEFESLDDSYNYTCKEQLSYCYSCSCLCKDGDDFYCDYGKFGLGLANRESIEWKSIEAPTETTCTSFGNRNPLGLTLFSSSYCENCRYYLKDKGCMKSDVDKTTKIKWTKIENPKFEKCKQFERASSTIRTALHTGNDTNCYKCKYFNTTLGCMNKKGKPKASYKEIEKPELHVCKAYMPSSLRKHDYKNSCLTCKFFIKGKGCVNPERKAVKDIKRLSPPSKR